MKDHLDSFFALREEIFEVFGYQEQWRQFVVEDSREYFWVIVGSDVWFAESPDELKESGEKVYSNSIYTYRHLSKFVYEADGYTMVLGDTQTDGNILLQVFDNTKRSRLKR